MYKNILHLTDLNADHILLGQQSANLAKKFDAKLYLLHVIEEPSSVQFAQALGFAEIDPPPIHDAKLVMQTLANLLHIPTNQQHVELGSLQHNVARLIEDLNIDLIILGSHTAAATPTILAHSGSKILEEPPCDLLIIKC